jgi:enamine deaminase RidA (YjgF/YER057c/UK114 family)
VLNIEARLQALGLPLPPPAPPAANYEPAVIARGFIFVSGQAPMRDGRYQFTGRVGAELTLDAGRQAARLCALNILSNVNAALRGDWSRLKRCVRITGYVSSAPGFFEQPRVVDGASDLMVELLGEPGRHARSAVGVSALRANAPVIIEALFELAD